jgi:1,4-dihydroxy-2-naphthoate octaprenyltransferase
MRFQTLSPNDKDFKLYLDGQVSAENRAIKVNSLNDGYQKSKITFEIVDSRHLLDRPPFLFAFLESLRVRYWIFVLLPLFVYLSFCQVDGVNWRFDMAILVILGSLFAFSSTAQLSDILDYQKGWDQIKPQDYTVLTKGWLCVLDLKKSVAFGLLVTLGIAVIMLVTLPTSFFALFIVVLFLALAWIQPPFELKYKTGGEIVIYLLLGPLLMTGFALAITGNVVFEDIILGSLFGLSSMFLYQLKRFQYLMPESRSKLSTTFVRLGFDKSKTYLLILIGAFLLLTAAYQFFFHGWEWAGVHGLVGFIGIYVFKLRLKKTHSPLGHNVRKMQQIGRSLIFISYSIWILQSIWYFVIGGLFYAN